MRAIVLISVLIGLLGSSGCMEDDELNAAGNTNRFSDITYEEYVNDRFLFCVKYPSFLEEKGKVPGYGGQVYESGDGTFTMRLYGMNNNSGISIDRGYQNFIGEDTSDIHYHVITDNSYTVSGNAEEDDVLYYRKVMLHLEQFKVLHIEYPAGQDDVYDPVVEKISNSFKNCQK